ncbi:unnamed protein product [Kuraishia capsulata CBS 1993]|uniref:glutamine--tRNA ligase n=1 Tax=Kuraishia capsulata CBS 1993 TaxID=1382522 RepID=W6MH33_9ASCO|nr:uncharacterized protein KUCA_T00001218001 [Kuraishia capsulata CBS 1993]CDK25251.1 unnamed protein product [Kuraishia capsulata CBS 1993]
MNASFFLLQADNTTLTIDFHASMSAELCEAFKKIGFEDSKVNEITKNKKVANALEQIVSKLDVTAPLDKSKLALLHSLSTSIKSFPFDNKYVWLAEFIVSGGILTNLQVAEGVKAVNVNPEITRKELEVESGVGVSLTPEFVEAEIVKFMQDNKEELNTKGAKKLPWLMSSVKQVPELKWAQPSLFKPLIDKHLGDFLETSKANAEGGKPVASAKRSMFNEGFLGDLHKPGKNPQMWPELMPKHLEVTGGKVYTRFPPEPNGFLHIGHSKAIMVNFGYAKFNNGHCYLRYDDTNPEAEEERYFKSILEMIEWLGFEPWKITYSSDYFDELYALAEKLISLDKGYVCHCTAEEVKLQRGLKADGNMGGERFACPHRSRPIEESLVEFRNMKAGKYKIGEATLRMKQDLESPNPQMWDLVAYRVLNATHHRTGDKWKIYPTYDFTHCLVDSFENISHSLCTTEFYLSRESYEWLCDVLHVYRPAQREYGRLNISGTIMSKRKIAKLVNEGYVRGWDDPRLYTLEAIKRRGIPPGAILSFINTLGVTTSTTNIQAVRFESAVRAYLDATTPRLMMIVDPVKVVLENVEDDFEVQVEIPLKPGNADLGDRKISLGKTFFIERSDFKEEADDEYFRLALNQSVGLIKVPYTISATSVEKDGSGKITLIHAKYNKDEPIKPKTFIQWVPSSSAIKISELRVQSQLFKSDNPSSVPEGYLSDINPQSEEVFHDAIVEPAFLDIRARSPLNLKSPSTEFNIVEKKGPETVRFQALRLGYFCLDKDSTDDKIVLNRIVTLKEDSKK